MYQKYSWIYENSIGETSDDKFSESICKSAIAYKKGWDQFYKQNLINGLIVYRMSRPVTDYNDQVLGMPPIDWMIPPIYRGIVNNKDFFDLKFIENFTLQKKTALLDHAKAFGFGISLESTADLTETPEEEIKRAKAIKEIEKKCQDFMSKEAYKNHFDKLNEYIIDYGYCGILFQPNSNEMRVLSPEQVYWDVKAEGLYKEDSECAGFVEVLSIKEIKAKYQALKTYPKIKVFLDQYLIDYRKKISSPNNPNNQNKGATTDLFSPLNLNVTHHFVRRLLIIEDVIKQFIQDHVLDENKKPYDLFKDFADNITKIKTHELKIDDFIPLIDLFTQLQMSDPKFTQELIVVKEKVKKIIEAVQLKKPVQEVYHFTIMCNDHSENPNNKLTYCVIENEQTFKDMPVIFCGQSKRVVLSTNAAVFKENFTDGILEYVTSVFASAIPLVRKLVENELQLLAEKRSNPQMLIVRPTIVQDTQDASTSNGANFLDTTQFSARHQHVHFASHCKPEIPLSNSLQIVEIRDRIAILQQERVMLLEKLDSLIPIAPKDHGTSNDPASNLSYITKLSESLKVVSHFLNTTKNAFEYFFNLMKKNMDSEFDSSSYQIVLKASGGAEFQSAQNVNALIAYLPFVQNDPMLTQSTILAILEASQNPVFNNLIKIMKAQMPQDEKSLIDGKITTVEYQQIKAQQAQENPPQPTVEEQLLNLEAQKSQSQAELKSRELDLKELEVTAKVDKLEAEAIKITELTEPEVKKIEAETVEKKSISSNAKSGFEKLINLNSNKV